MSSNYWKHNWITEKAEVKKSPVGGTGVFARELIKKGTLVAVWGGVVLTRQELRAIVRRYPGFRYPVQINTNFWIGPLSYKELDEGEYFNHSCEPNCGVFGSNMLVAMRDINSGEEITFDYSMTDSQDLKMVCHCGTSSCRKIIKGSDWRRPELQKKYQKYFSVYLKEKIKKSNYYSK